jgi:hypothetical protein
MAPTSSRSRSLLPLAITSALALLAPSPSHAPDDPNACAMSRVTAQCGGAAKPVAHGAGIAETCANPCVREMVQCVDNPVLGMSVGPSEVNNLKVLAGKLLSCSLGLRLTSDVCTDLHGCRSVRGPKRAARRRCVQHPGHREVLRGHEAQRRSAGLPGGDGPGNVRLRRQRAAGKSIHQSVVHDIGVGLGLWAVILIRGAGGSARRDRDDAAYVRCSRPSGLRRGRFMRSSGDKEIRKREPWAGTCMYRLYRHAHRHSLCCTG